MGEPGENLSAGEPRGAVVIITNRRGELLLHLRDDIDGIAWPGHWSLLGGGCDPGENPTDAIVRELHEEAGLTVHNPAKLFETKDVHGSGQLITFFATTWDGDETRLPLAEGVKLQFFAPEHLAHLTIPPYIRQGILRFLSSPPVQ
ncbi:NUDIX hydrolase [Actinomadura craniellae]|uniref:NUDIX hydrolase n=1 Tax=Actinomadura craniellae TaxID=2231787 RepID=A0A365H5H1_9ACTN|nr:NUDIX domain-containing protein [Actinomadura craniellae]RAY13483.1 NUDIX hydrolase [Actinomadura craniellae]